MYPPDAVDVSTVLQSRADWCLVQVLGLTLQPVEQRKTLISSAAELWWKRSPDIYPVLPLIQDVVSDLQVSFRCLGWSSLEELWDSLFLLLSDGLHFHFYFLLRGLQLIIFIFLILFLFFFFCVLSVSTCETRSEPGLIPSLFAAQDSGFGPGGARRSRKHSGSWLDQYGHSVPGSRDRLPQRGRQDPRREGTTSHSNPLHPAI